jgi:quinol monooxygenase YgiN
MTLEVEIVRIPVAAADAAELVQALEGARAGYLAAPACQNLTLLVNEVRDEVAAVVTWSSAQAHADALKTPQAASFFTLVSRLASARPDVRTYLPTGAEGE